MNARHPTLLALSTSFAGLTVSLPSHADVTAEEVVSLDAFSLKMDINSVERISADKRRSDSETRCHGVISLFCRDIKSAEIVRLDKQLEWQLEPKQKTYVEKPFPTAEERAKAREQMQAVMEKMKNCPKPAATSAQTGPDTSQCELSTPKVDVKDSNEHLTLLGHDARKTSVVLSQSCTDKTTGDVCEFNYGFDSWLTNDELPGSAERLAFQKKYLTAQGLDPEDPQLQGMMRQFLAQYSDQMKELQAHASELKGYPLRTVFTVSFGGEHCGKAQQQQQTAQAADSASHDVGLKKLATTAVGSKIAGLFSKHGASSEVGAAAGEAGANATGAAADKAASESTSNGTQAAAPATAAAAAPNTVRVMSVTIETRSINSEPIPASQFEVPAGWKQQAVRNTRNAEQEFSCPATGAK